MQQIGFIGISSTSDRFIPIIQQSAQRYLYLDITLRTLHCLLWRNLFSVSSWHRTAVHEVFRKQPVEKIDGAAIGGFVLPTATGSPMPVTAGQSVCNDRQQ